MPKKLYDLAVKTGSYTKNGETKGRYENIGSVLQLDDGGKMILIKRTFNPAGVPFKEGSDQIAISMFEPKEQGDTQRPAPASRPAADFSDMESDLPF